jgi:hypothetical protein
VVPVGTLQFDTAGSSAVAITGLLAYRNGFEFFVTRLVRPVLNLQVERTQAWPNA